MDRKNKVVTFDAGRCARCGLCIERFKDYCISELDGIPVIDYRICNVCQKCVAICPSQAIMVNSTAPERIKGEVALKPTDLLALLARRRSIKVFKERRLPQDKLRSIVEVAKYAPNQNKNIDAIVINDREIIEHIDLCALQTYRRMYRALFSVKALTSLLSLFSPFLFTSKKKMEFDLLTRRKIVKPGTQALILMVGNRRVPVTESSAQYMLATMIIFSESLGIGSCLMDSLRIAINMNSKIRNRLKIPKAQKVLGVLALGYSDEKIVNIPRGYELNVQWNRGKNGS